VTDHAAERFRQRVGSRRGAVDVRPEIAARVADAVAAGRTTTERAGVLVRDGEEPHVIYVCRPDGGELVVVTLWEDDDAPGGPRVPRRFTDELRSTDRAVRERWRPEEDG
jgi:hypothetical protein